MRERQKFRQAGKGAGKVADPVFQYNFDDLVRQRRQPLSEEPFMSGIWPKPPVRLWRELSRKLPIRSANAIELCGHSRQSWVHCDGLKYALKIRRGAFPIVWHSMILCVGEAILRGGECSFGVLDDQLPIGPRSGRSIRRAGCRARVARPIQRGRKSCCRGNAIAPFCSSE